MAVSKERIAELRAGWAADRDERRNAFKRDWPMHLSEVLRMTGLGFVFGLSLEIWLFRQYLGGL